MVDRPSHIFRGLASKPNFLNQLASPSLQADLKPPIDRVDRRRYSAQQAVALWSTRPDRPNQQVARAGLKGRSAKPSRSNGFSIRFDFRFDTNRWFTPLRKAALRAAAKWWEQLLLDDFDDTPVGKRTSGVINPRTGEIFTFKTDRNIDDVLIFVSSERLSVGTLAAGGPSIPRAGVKRYTGDDFEPWIGSISFNPAIPWFFDRSPQTDNDIPVNRYDFISAAAHEIGHVLGFLTGVNAFYNQVIGTDFVGANAVLINNGFPIPLDPLGSSHIADNYEFGGSGEALMDPVQGLGRRTRPTILDAAIMNDLGYVVNYNATYQNSSVFSSALRQPVASSARSAYARCGCAACLMTS